MSVLKDVQCDRCGCVAETMLDPDVTVTSRRCHGCGRICSHRTICNGGCGKRYRYHDWDGVDFAGQVKVHAPTAETQLPDSQGGGVIEDRTRDGKLCSDRPRFSDDVRQDRQERIYHQRRQLKGKTPIYVDLGKG